MMSIMIANQLIRPVDYQKLVFIASFRVGLKLAQNMSNDYYVITGSKYTISQISLFKVDDVFGLFHYTLCHSSYQKINRKPEILLQFLPPETVLYSYHDAMTSP